MASNFFTNQGENTLYKKFVGVFFNMQNIEYFKSVIGYFRASGYFAIRKHFPADLKVKIIAGINVDPFIALAQKQGLLFNANAKDTKQSFIENIQQDIINAKYSKHVEDGILQLIDDIASGRIEIKAHNSKKLHSKFYIFLSPNFNEHNPNGLVIMGSSNLSAQGLGLEDVEHNYEMNVELRDYENVRFADNEFEKLLEQSTPILPVDAHSLIKKTYLETTPTPFELYVKFLIEFFGKNIEYDPDSISDIPLKKFKKLSYQIDAVNQGYELLLKYNGFFLADVVGTGKTVMAALLAKKFIIQNGGKTRVLVVYPPALEKNWTSTFKEFQIQNYCDFITNGSLDKIVDGKFKNEKEVYDLILVDEAHKFRNHQSQQFQNLQIICKSGRENIGNIEGFDKKVVLISATPLNNRPEDIYNLISLFQDRRNSNLNESNLQKFFAPHIARYKLLIQQTPINLQAIQDIFNDIRDKVIKDITIRRTRTDLTNNERYKQDLDKQGIIFPKVADPFANQYVLSHHLAELFVDTANAIINKSKIDFYRYQAIAYLTDEANNGLYQNTQTVSRSLAFIMQTQLIKRLESSFYAFKKSLNKITTSTKQMIEMYERDSVFIAPNLDISDLLNKGYTDEEIEIEVLKINDENPKNKKFKQTDFKKGFIEGLKNDYEHLSALNEKWQAIDDHNDSKWKVFIELLKTEYFDSKKNELGKLVIFTESTDTLNYLTERLKNETQYKVLSISSENRSRMFDTIRENFDANYEGKPKNDYDIILTTDVLAEGVNLHRANVIVNYDTPWNPTKLIQRLGRINRIGTEARNIYNYNFYPSEQGNNRIRLIQMSLAKLQSSHSTFGEDNKIYSLDEIIDNFRMFEEKQEGERDIRTEYLEWLRKFREQHHEHFETIKKMPLKVRCIRKATDVEQSLAFVKNGEHKNIYLYSDGKSFAIPFETAVKIFEAPKDEQGISSIPEIHYIQINHILRQFEKDITTPEMIGGANDKADSRTQTSISRLSNWLVDTLSSEESKLAAENLLPMLKNGTYSNLTTEIYKLRNEANVHKLEMELIALSKKYTSKIKRNAKKDTAPLIPQIIISETFVQ